MGTAFGQGPAHGALPGQMEVSGFQGRGLVNSYVGGDDSTGTLNSPSFQIQRPFLNFLVGGGGFANETCLNLRLNGATVHTATGPNTSPGGSERLDWSSWDVREFVGQTAVLEIVDSRKGGWGHINVDQIVQSDRRRGPDPASRTIALTERYLHLPVQNSAPVRKVTIHRSGVPVREFDIKLAEGKPDFWVFDDLRSLQGNTLEVAAVLPAGSTALASIAQGAQPTDSRMIGREAGRPRFHFTSRRGWLNDPNGLVFQDDEYHLFYQHNPYGWDWGNMHWGHAVSRDLVHWGEVGEAIRPRAYGDWAFSGSAVIDRENTSGFGTEGRAPLVAAFTSTARGECIVFSNDGGRAFTEYEKNPVVKHRGRDPRLLWHEKTRRWVMAVYDEDQDRRSIAFHSSPDLKIWRYESRIEPFFECPDIFELPVVGAERATTRWVLYAADGQYLLGTFDGRTFTPDSPVKQRLWYGSFYAAQTFSDTPDGRRVQLGWARGITFPGEPFNQQMTVAVALSLRKTPRGTRMFAQPVAELKALRNKTRQVGDDANLAERPFAMDLAESSDVELVLKLSDDARVAVDVGGNSLIYDASEGKLTTGAIRAPLAVADGVLSLRIPLDRGSVEVFAEDGAVAFSLPSDRSSRPQRMTVSSSRGEVRVVSGHAYEMDSIWQ
jgi:fructan beta-fructosidase